MTSRRRVGPGGEQRFDYRRILVVLGRSVQGGVVEATLRRRVGPGGEQHFDYRRMMSSSRSSAAVCGSLRMPRFSLY